MNSGEYIPDIFGCPKCMRVFSSMTFDGGEDDDFTCRNCTGCGSPVISLGEPPKILEEGGEVFLLGKGGMIAGPYSTIDEAQAHLWAWFCEREKNGKEEAEEETKESREGLRLVSIEGISVDQGKVCAQETDKENSKGEINQASGTTKKD